MIPMSNSDARKRLNERANGDTCQTPGCGHAREAHNDVPHWMYETISSNVVCPCTRYTAPTETVRECELGHDFVSTKRGTVECEVCGIDLDDIPTRREQVLADAEAAWETYSGKPVSGTNPVQPLFRDGYLAGKGIDHE